MPWFGTTNHCDWYAWIIAHSVMLLILDKPGPRLGSATYGVVTLAQCWVVLAYTSHGSSLNFSSLPFSLEKGVILWPLRYHILVRKIKGYLNLQDGFEEEKAFASSCVCLGLEGETWRDGCFPMMVMYSLNKRK